VVNLLLTVIPSFVNQSKWATNGSSSYAITANDNVHNYYQGENIVTVKDGKVIAVKNARTVKVQDLKDYYRFTIDGLFSEIYTCAFLFPLNWCTNEYEPHYGYPTKLEINCPIDILCQTNITVTKVELASP
jgi:hypothetical protein